MTIDLSPAEIEALREILRAHEHELLIESARTDTHDYRARLNDRREVVEHILERLE